MIVLLCFAGDDAQTELITLSVDPSGASSGGTLCPDTNIYFHCIAQDVTFLIWQRNGRQIEDYTRRNNAPFNSTMDGYTLFLNTSTPAQSAGERRNLTSTLVGTVGSGLQSGDLIGCVDTTGQLITLNFTVISK